MAEEMTFECVYCHAENRLNTDRVKAILAAKGNVPLICGNCARLQEGQQIAPRGNDNWLRCIPYEGVAVDVPAGPEESVSGITMWTDAKGRKLTRIQFILEHGLDPVVYWFNKNRLEQAFHHEVTIGEPPKIQLG
jgi:hypothetical protein